MKEKIKEVYVCSECGYQSAKWMGQCPSCLEWNTMEAQLVTPQPTGRAARMAVGDNGFNPISALRLSAIDQNAEHRIQTGTTELDRVLGGGIVNGSVVLLGGEPGAGKSTIMLQMCGAVAQLGQVLYVSGEESARQIKLRADRLHINSDNISIATSTNIASVCDTIAAMKPALAVIDSIQTMELHGLNSSPGTVSQIRECTSLLLRTAKEQEVPVFIIGHVNKDGAIAGPKVLEHIVDTVLYFEGERHLAYRILRAVKNRFGSTNEIGVFEMGECGLAPVDNPSMMLLEGRPENVPGSCVTSILEGSRPIMVEVQALLSKSVYASPRRTSDGFDYNRMALLTAVLEKRGGFPLSSLDAFINVVGGLRLDDPSADLAVVLALVSSLRDKPIPQDMIVLGEVGLSGEVRAVSNITPRLTEAGRLGFRRCILPFTNLNRLKDFSADIELLGVRNLSGAFSYIN